jgi:hypothetical protein
MPLVRSFELSKKKSKEAWVKPAISADKKSVHFEVQHGKGNVPDGTVNRNGARCVCCGGPVALQYIRDEGKQGRIGAKLMAIVAEGQGGRVYLSPNQAHIQAADVPKPEHYPDAPLPHNPRDFKTPNYGMLSYASLFTNRQLTALTTFSDLVGEAIKQIEQDVGVPRSDCSVQDRKISVSSSDLSVPNRKISAPSSDCSAPNRTIDSPSFDCSIQDRKISAPSFDCSVPSRTIDSPRADVESPRADIDSPRVETDS